MWVGVQYVSMQCISNVSKRAHSLQSIHRKSCDHNKNLIVEPYSAEVNTVTCNQLIMQSHSVDKGIQ